MAELASFTLKKRNPDVLTCIANLSNDEVFTPPEFAKQMLDTLERAWSDANDGASIWSDSKVKFLDPCTKSGVFLREIVERLAHGLESEIPDLQTRVDHILTKQVFGIGITHLTSLLARRSVYCSKFANGEHSVASSFDNADGNIWFESIKHTWVGGTQAVETADEQGNPILKKINGKCKYCGASQSSLERSIESETHAYAFIHTEDVNNFVTEIYGEGMQFDVIIGNPPYQLGDGGHSASAGPIYQHFIQQAMNLEPRMLAMVTPSRWFVGGKGLDQFRKSMLADNRLRKIVDFIVDKDAFPGVNINGGVNFFLWQRDSPGLCEITTVAPGGIFGKPVERSLKEFDIFIRRNESISILRKVLAKDEENFAQHVSSRKPFGLPTDFHGQKVKSTKFNIKLYGSGAISWVTESEILANHNWVEMWKVLVPRATDGNENYPLPIWNQSGPFVSGPGEACSETYLVAAVVEDQETAELITRFMRTKFFRFLVSLRKMTQDNKADVFTFVPDLDMDKAWTDEALYTRYNLNPEEIKFIESQIRHMEFEDE